MHACGIVGSEFIEKKYKQLLLPPITESLHSILYLFPILCYQCTTLK